MNNFWDLVRFEFKKIFHRKVFFASLIISFAIIILHLIVAISGTSFWHKVGNDISQYEAMKLDKATIASNQGYITSELISKAILSNREMMSNDDNYLINEYGKHLKEDAYIKYVLPYESVVNLINVIYEEEQGWLSMDSFSLVSVKPEKAIDNLTPEMIQSFDADFKEFSKSMILRKEGLTTAEIEKNIALADQIERPLYNDYYGGYQAYINSSKALALSTLFLILILLAPLFSNEYEEKTDQLILCTRNGKGSLCKAKLFISLTVSILSSILIMGISWLSFLLLFGFEGADVNIQVVNPSCTYPITLLEACLIHFMSVMVAATLFGAFIVFLSARVKKRSSSVVIMGTLITIIPMFIWVPLKQSRFIYDVLQFFPINAVTFKFETHFFGVFGRLFTPYKFIWVVSILLMIVFFTMATRSFKRHQVT